MVNTKIQTISKKCQNNPRYVNRLLIAGDVPYFKIWNIINAIQIKPIETCVPCVPTNVKNEDKAALTCQLLPSAYKFTNSCTSMMTNDNPKIKVTINQKIARPRLFL